MAFHPFSVDTAKYSQKWLVTLPTFLFIADGMKMARAARMGSLL
jgi:hypothetical protein